MHLGLREVKTLVIPSLQEVASFVLVNILRLGRYKRPKREFVAYQCVLL